LLCEDTFFETIAWGPDQRGEAVEKNSIEHITMKRNLKIFWLLSIFSIKTTLQRRAGVISFFLGKILRFVFFFMFIYFLVSRSKLLAGYSLSQTLVFFLTFNFIDTMAQLLFREVYRFRPMVISGEFDSILIKPFHPFLKILIGGIDIIDFITIIPYFLLLIYFIAKIPHLNFFNIILYMGFVINGLCIATSFHILVLAVAIFTAEIDHALMIYRDLTRMLALPIDIYKEPIRSFLMFVVPVGIMIALPVKVLFGLLSINVLLLSGMISLLFIIFSLWLWSLALKKYQSVGS